MLPRSEVADDRPRPQPGDRVLLIIEDDVSFARILLDMAREKGFKGIVATRGDGGLALARELQARRDHARHRPAGHGRLDGARPLKHDPATRHIPVHIISAADERQRGLQLGRASPTSKSRSSREALDGGASTDIKSFVERRVKNLLVVEDDEAAAQQHRRADRQRRRRHHRRRHGGRRRSTALQERRTSTAWCSTWPAGHDRLRADRADQAATLGLTDLPIIIYTGKDLTQKEETELKRVADTIIVKDVRSPERLLDETALFLHRVEANLPEPKRQMLEQLHQTDPVLAGKKVLIVDDDMRNIFALTSVLERHQMQVLYAENGRDGHRDCCKNTPDIDIVLMDS